MQRSKQLFASLQDCDNTSCIKNVNKKRKGLEPLRYQIAPNLQTTTHSNYRQHHFVFYCVLVVRFLLIDY